MLRNPGIVVNYYVTDFDKNVLKFKKGLPINALTGVCSGAGIP